ncbi:MAG: tetratricopeptide repeat protein [Bacteroidetes bacterium]|nr:tetratricopeptide repeat protein [Bacteroidota bacterium]
MGTIKGISPLGRATLLFLVFFFLCSASVREADYIPNTKDNIAEAPSGNFDFNVNCRNAYDAILQLKIKEGRRLIKREKKNNPDNIVPFFLENYIDFLLINVNNNYEEFKVLEKNRIRRLNKIRTGDRKSPYYLYFQAEIYMQWAISRLNFNQYLTAFLEMRKAYQLLTENAKKFPDFVANKKSLGMIHTVIGTIPDNFKWASNVMNLKGSIRQGTEEIEEAIAYSKTHDYIFAQETNITYVFLILYMQNDPERAWNMVQSDMFPLDENILHHFTAALIAFRTGHNDRCIEILENRPQGNEFMRMPFLDYLHGLAKLQRLDDDANVYLEKYIKYFQGLNYVKNSYQKLAWFYLLKDDLPKYKAFMQQCKDHGNTLIDADKQAQKEAEKKEIPHTNLLKARLLSDGGYYKIALELLEGKSVDDFTRKRDKIEFTYRAGRIYDLWGKPDKAMGYYVTTIKNGGEESYYFAANAALMMGIIYEHKQNFSKAETYFHKCLAMKDHEYKNSIDMKAKAGLKRIEEWEESNN